MWMWGNRPWQERRETKAFHATLNREAESGSLGVLVFLLEMADLQITCQCGKFHYLLTHILRGSRFFFVLSSAAILQTAFLPVLHYRFKKTVCGTSQAYF
jgi:hypothetical protein